MEEILALPWDGMRHECVAGEHLVTPAPSRWHQKLLVRIVTQLGRYVERQPVAEVYVSPADIVFAEDTLVQPDLFAVPIEAAQGGRAESWSAIRRLLLAIEIVSPSSGRADRFVKRRLYQAQGVPLYWCVDPVAEEVEIWTPTSKWPYVERGTLSWLPPGASEPLTLSVAELFRE